MKVAVLTSSRADYGIYLPLLKTLQNDDYFELKLIVFGTHLSRFHGYTIDQIKQDGFEVEEQLETLILGDTEEAVSNAIGNTITKFSSVWKRLKDKVDIVFALGDRYEMFAAVAASVPFNITVAHLHGGETTLGAIDNKFRHAITLMATYHFTATQNFAEKVIKLTGSEINIHNVGALSLDNLIDFKLLSIADFKKEWNIDLSIPTILTTFHPETVSTEKNEAYTISLIETINELSKKYQVVITMPNADTMGMIVRNKLNKLIEANPKVIGIENFGTLGYFSCMNHCAFLLGNTSSGIIEAASFGKYVINLGDRQKGRAQSHNTLDVALKKQDILSKVKEIEKNKFNYSGNNIYTSESKSGMLIVKTLKKIS